MRVMMAGGMKHDGDGGDGMKHDGAAGRMQGNKARAAGFVGTWYRDHPARDPPPRGNRKNGRPRKQYV